ncbi:Zinc finger C2H2-type protein [Macrophomina phaseolina MS6]|uniref:Zinc finger C2H2-type protein n=1 Tax=Macrophomina phaseolina (strain MS6) TaxID=1126212 RepID=K2SIT6_MACPH|nr:Zinc finger C2H2-type protein [Macrophomina phaseolina MS6]
MCSQKVPGWGSAVDGSSHHDTLRSGEVCGVDYPAAAADHAELAPLKRKASSLSPVPTKKRKAEDTGQTEATKEAEKQIKKPSSSSSTTARRFACPFFQRRPTRTKSSCVYPGFSSIARLKEHLYRQHMQPAYQCTRCMACFDSDGELRDHSRAEVPCEIKPNNIPDGITAEQEKALKSKKRTNKPGKVSSDVEKWREIYGLLFPCENIPSPYCNPVSASSEYEVILRREFPECLKVSLDVLLGSCEEYQKISLLDIATDCLDRVLSGWQRDSVSESTAEDGLSPNTDTEARHGDSGSPSCCDAQTPSTEIGIVNSRGQV